MGQCGRRTFPLLARAGVFALAALATACSTAPKELTEKFQLVWPAAPDKPRYYFERTIASSKDLAERSFADKLRHVATGEDERGQGLAKPFGVVVVDGRIFVGDTVGRRVVVYDLAHKRFYDFGASGEGGLSKPLGIAADRRNHIYVVDSTAKKINVYDLDGKFITALGTGEQLDRPSGVAVNADGSRVYVVDTGGVGSTNHHVRVFDGASGAHLFDFGSRGSEPGQFNFPKLATVGPDGSVYVTDAGNSRIEKFTADGQFLMAVGSRGRQTGQLSQPKGVAVDGQGKIFVVDAAFGNFQIFDPEGHLLMHVGERHEQGGPARYQLPAGIAADADGRIYVVDQFLKKIDVFRPAELPAAASPTARAS
jgi:DNA-binding beta-propeller fold protein YncE